MTAEFTSWLVCAVVVVLGVFVPLLEKGKVFGKFVSLRWICTVFLLGCLLGVLVDFVHLDEMTRHVVAIGAIVVVGVFIVVRSIEKWKRAGFSSGVESIDVTAGKVGAKIEFAKSDEESTKKTRETE